MSIPASSSTPLSKSFLVVGVRPSSNLSRNSFCWSLSKLSKSIELPFNISSIKLPIKSFFFRRFAPCPCKLLAIFSISAGSNLPDCFKLSNALPPNVCLFFNSKSSSNCNPLGFLPFERPIFPGSVIFLYDIFGELFSFSFSSSLPNKSFRNPIYYTIIF